MSAGDDILLRDEDAREVELVLDGFPVKVEAEGPNVRVRVLDLRPEVEERLRLTHYAW